MSSADRPSDDSSGSAIWLPAASSTRTRISSIGPSLRATKASAPGARRARGVSVAYPAGRWLSRNVITRRCSIPRPPRGVAIDSKASGGAVARPAMSSAAAARSKFAPASWYIDSASPRSANASRVVNRSPIAACSAARSAADSAGWFGSPSETTPATTDPGVAISACASFHPSATVRSELTCGALSIVSTFNGNCRRTTKTTQSISTPPIPEAS